MRIRREKGFRRIEIADPDSDAIKNKFWDLSDIKYKKCLIIFLSLIIIFLLFEIFYFISQNNDSYELEKTNEKPQNNSNNSLNELNNKNYSMEKKYEDLQKENNDKNIDNNNNNNQIIESENANNNDKNNKEGDDNIFDKTFKEIENPKVSIIIIINNNNIKDESIKKLIHSIYEQRESNIEIIIVDDFIDKSNSMIYEKLKEKDKRMKILTYEEKIGNLKKRINGINNSKSDYLLFIDADDSFSNNNIIERAYNQSIQDKIDILEFKTFHYLQCEESKPKYQPELFDMMYYGLDNFNDPKQFHLSGKLIKKSLFTKILEDMDKFYMDQNMDYYEEDMLLFILFKKAESFELLMNSGTTKICRKTESNVIFDNIESKIGFIIYIKFMLENSGNNVPEKRMISNLFINEVVDRNLIFSKKEYNKILLDTVELFNNCEKINEYELKKIGQYKNKISSMMEQKEK